MKTARALFLLLLVIALAASLHPLVAQIAPQIPPAAASAPVTRAQADHDYAEKSYALALPEYQSLLGALPPKSPSRMELEYRIAVALGASQQWDAAVTAWAAFLTAHANQPLWTARAHYQRGLLLNLIPHQGYKVGTRLYRGNDYPHTTNAEKPEYVWLQQDDMQAALADFEQAAMDYDKQDAKQIAELAKVKLTVHLYVGEAGPEPPFVQIKDPPPPHTPSESHGILVNGVLHFGIELAGEKTDLYFDLVRSLHPVGYQWRSQEWGSEDDWKAAKKINWAIDTHLPYDPKWPQPKKILYLLARIPTLNPAHTHTTVLAELARGLYIAQAHNGWAKSEYVVPPGHPEKGAYKITQTLPYFVLDPLAILTKTASTYPHNPQAPQIRLIIAQ